jgi:hypothetical protein
MPCPSPQRLVSSSITLSVWLLEMARLIKRLFDKESHGQEEVLLGIASSKLAGAIFRLCYKVAVSIPPMLPFGVAVALIYSGPPIEDPTTI